jgi:hypothetical protein
LGRVRQPRTGCGPETSVRRLVEELIALGPELTEAAARQAVDECIRRFNGLDDGWICTIEREDICEQVGRAIDLCGFVYAEEWLNERDW